MIGSIWRNGACLASLLAAVALPAAGYGQAQPAPGGGQVSVPGSSIEKPGDTGVRAHTNVEIFIPNRGAGGAPKAPGGDSSGAANPPASPGPGGKASDSLARPQ